jgi:hypothetical protein
VRVRLVDAFVLSILYQQTAETVRVDDVRALGIALHERLDSADDGTLDNV